MRINLIILFGFIITSIYAQNQPTSVFRIEKLHDTLVLVGGKTGTPETDMIRDGGAISYREDSISVSDLLKAGKVDITNCPYCLITSFTMIQVYKDRDSAGIWQETKGNTFTGDMNNALSNLQFQYIPYVWIDKVIYKKPDGKSYELSEGLLLFLLE